MPEDQIRAGNLPPGAVRRVGDWAVGNADGHLFAVSRRCRHQLADLAGGTVDAEGCLVCPWHQSRYDVRTGEMVAGPHGFLFFHGPTPGYSQLVRAYSRRLRCASAGSCGAALTSSSNRTMMTTMRPLRDLLADR